MKRHERCLYKKIIEKRDRKNENKIFLRDNEIYFVISNIFIITKL